MKKVGIAKKRGKVIRKSKRIEMLIFRVRVLKKSEDDTRLKRGKLIMKSTQKVKRKKENFPGKLPRGWKWGAQALSSQEQKRLREKQ